MGAGGGGVAALVVMLVVQFCFDSFAAGVGAAGRLRRGTRRLPGEPAPSSAVRRW